MKGSWATLCTVQVTHTYWGGDCADLELLVPPAAAAAARRARLLLRLQPGRLTLLAETDGQGGARVPFAGLALQLGLRALRPQLCNYTQLPLRRPFYSNRAAAGVLAAPVEAALCGHRAAVAVTDPARPAQVVVRGLDGAARVTEDLPVGDGREEVSLDLSGLVPGRYTLETPNFGPVLQTPLVLDPDLAAAGVLGLVELLVDASMLAAPPALTVPLTAVEQRLCYYVVAQNLSPADFALLSVSDAGAAEDGRPAIPFERVDSGAFTAAELPAALLGGAGDQIALFRSTAPLARQARGRRRLQLNKNGDVLIANLPQPPADSSTSDVIVRVSKP